MDNAGDWSLNDAAPDPSVAPATAPAPQPSLSSSEGADPPAATNAPRGDVTASPPRGAAALLLPSYGQGTVTGVGQAAKGIATLNQRRQMLAPFWDIYQKFDSLTPEQQNAAILAIQRATVPPHHPLDLSTAAQAEWQPPPPRRPYLPAPTADWLIDQLQSVPKDQKAKSFDAFAGPPPEGSGLYTQGEAINRWSEPWVTPEERKLHPYATGIPSAIGGATIGVGTTALASAAGHPEVGVALGAGQMGLATAADQYDRALAKQAEPPAAIPGMRASPTIDLGRRPVVHNSDGTISTLAPIAIDRGGAWVLVPTIATDGSVMSDAEAAANYQRTGQHLGGFDSEAAADAYAHQLHRQQEWLHGMDAETARTNAAREAFAGGVALGGLPLGAILRPVERAAPGVMPWLTAKARQYAQAAPVFATVGEAQAWLAQQIARENYDPTAEYSPDPAHIAASLATATLGTALPARVREGRADAAATPHTSIGPGGGGEAGRRPPSTEVLPSAPEPSNDIQAQIAALADPAHPKDTVFVAPGGRGSVPVDLPPGVMRVDRPEGTLLTTDRDKLAAFTARDLSSRDIADSLGHPEGRDEVLTHARQGGDVAVVQARDSADRVIAEAAASAPRIGETAAALYPQVPSGGRLVAVSPDEAQRRRIELAQAKPEGPRQGELFPLPDTAAKGALDLDFSSREDLEQWARGFGIAFTPKTLSGQLRAQVLERLEAITPLSEAGKQKLRIETVIDRAGAPLGLSLARPQLPEYDGETTHGILITNEGSIYPLRSGDPDPLYANHPAAKHVEGKAAIIIRETGSSGGIVYHNNSEGTCGFCNSQIKNLLPEGATLVVVPPKNAVPIKQRADARPRPHIGNSQLPKKNVDVGKLEGDPW